MKVCFFPDNSNLIVDEVRVVDGVLLAVHGELCGDAGGAALEGPAVHCRLSSRLIHYENKDNRNFLVL